MFFLEATIFLVGFGSLKIDFFCVLYYNCEWMTVRQSVDRYVSLLGCCMTSVLSELIDLKKLSISYHWRLPHHGIFFKLVDVTLG